ncbi:PAS domain S-box protein [Desulforhopalus sp. 52FAK]
MDKTKRPDQTLGLKLGFSILIVIFIIYGIFVLFDIQRVADLSRTIYDHPLVVSNAALQANTSIAKMHRNMKDVVLFKSSSKIREFIRAVDEEEKKVYQHLNEVRDNILGEQGKYLEEEARQLFDAWRLIRGEVIDSVNNNQSDRAANITIGKGADHVALLEEKMVGLTNYARTKASLFNADTQRAHRRLRITSILFLIAGILSSLLVAYLVIKRQNSISKDLLESEARYRSLIENQTDLVCRFTPDGHFSFVNDIYCDFFGMSKNRLIGSQWQPLPLDDDLDIINEKLSALSFKNPTVEIENRVRSGKGEIHWMHFSNSGIFDSEGNLLEIQSVGRDITDRKKSEDDLLESETRFARAVRGTSDGIWDWNVVTNEDYLSPRWKELLGFNEDELTNEYNTFFSRVHPDDVPRVQKAIDAHLEQCTPYDIKHRLRTKSGEYKWFHVRGMAERDEQGKPMNMSGSITDITESMQAEAEKEHLEKQLQQAQKMESIGNLAGGIAHDFNNILSAIIGFTELALDEAPAGSSQKEDLEEVLTASNRAKELVQQILAFARQSEKETIPVKLGDVVAETLKLLRPSTPTTIDIKTTINSTAKVMGNDSQLHQIVMNICTNAIHSLEKSGSVLEIALRDIVVEDSELETSRIPSGEYVELTITDNGPGIDPTIIDNIFEPYFTTKGVGEGSGLGLAMVKGIVESYGGDIAAHSELSKKTSFTIRLPMVTGKRKEDFAPISPVASGTERILLVDDEPPLARMGSRMLESLGYIVTIRTSSYEALELFKEKPEAFDLLITDMTMPSMTGDMLSMEVRKIRQDIPIVICTGYSNKINNLMAKQVGIEAFIYKPLNKADLAKTIREVLDTNQLSLV